MARKPRLHVPGGLYHVIVRGNSRQDVFFSAGDPEPLCSHELLAEGVVDEWGQAWYVAYWLLLVNIDAWPASPVFTFPAVCTTLLCAVMAARMCSSLPVTRHCSASMSCLPKR